MDRGEAMFLWLCVLIGSPLFVASGNVTLELVDIEYIPKTYVPGTFTGDEYEYDSQFARDVVVDEKMNLLYVVGDGRMTVMDYSNTGQLEIIHEETLLSYDLQSVEQCKGKVTVVGYDKTSMEGKLFIFAPFNMEGGYMHMIHSIPIGKLPRGHSITPNCDKIVIAVDGDTNDATIATIEFDGPWLYDGSPVVTHLNFSKFETQLAELEAEYFILRFGATSFASGLDPYDVAISSDGSTAYVSLRVNNAVAVVDLETNEITEIRPLGLKDWSAAAGTSGLDGYANPPEPDRLIQLTNGPIFSLYQPWSIEVVSIGGQDTILLGNRGRNAQNAGALNGFTLDDAVFAGLQPELLNNFNNLIILGGGFVQSNTDSDGEIEKIITTGGRGVSLLSTQGLYKLTDTASSIEETIRDLRPKLFNADPVNAETLSDDLDSRSRNEGPGPESVTTMTACGGRKIVMFTGVAHPGIVLAYTLDTQAPENGFQFQYIVDGYELEDSTLTDEQLYDAQKLSLRLPRSLTIIPGSQGRDPLLVVAGETSSTINTYAIKIDCGDVEGPAKQRKQRRRYNYWPRWYAKGKEWRDWRRWNYYRYMY